MRSDPVLEELQTLFSGRVGEQLPPDDLKVARLEAEERVRVGRPPGFKDASKEDPCGDYLLWYQSLLEAKRRSLPFILVTRDGKADWFLQIRGKSVGALPELVSEAYEFTGADFIALQTKTFLIYAQSELNAQVSVATLAQTDAIRTNAARRSHVIHHFTPDAVDQLRLQLQEEAMKIDNAYKSAEARLAALEEVQRSEATELSGVDREQVAHQLSREQAIVAHLRQARTSHLDLFRTMATPIHDHEGDALAFQLTAIQVELIREIEANSGRKFIPIDRNFWRRPRPAIDSRNALRTGAITIDKLTLADMRQILEEAGMHLPLRASRSVVRGHVLALLASEDPGAAAATDVMPDPD
ncbi:PIN-like domain-containing protein [Dactylosporangium sp. NPDC051541]|uniref:PIN-like domain-containing protein n=1 Tax=Dactylosporangium sp. NPDC051541 TaxID=3363977 RepID=UPI00378C054D